MGLYHLIIEINILWIQVSVTNYKEDGLLPIIHWVYDVKNVSIKSEPCEWITVKSRKKRN